MANFNSNQNSSKQKNNLKEGENNMKKFNLNEENENINNNEDTGNGTENTNEENGIAPAMIDGPIIWPADPTDPDEPEVQICRIALFQGGLDGQQDSLLPTIQGMIFDDNEDKFIMKSNLINMSNYNVDTDSFFGSGESDFESLIRALVMEGRKTENQGKTILIRTYLNKVVNSDNIYDTIAHQKEKLVKVIDEFDKYVNVKLYLVGHSQGGLVNLEAAIERYAAVDGMVSIATPYAPVFLAESLISLGICTLGLSNLIFNLSTGSTYKSCINTLSSESYFENLMNRWNSLNNKPELTVITGTIGRVCAATEDNAKCPAKCSAYAFDGLVRTSEQQSIPHAKYINFDDSDAVCMHGEKTMNCNNCTVPTLTLEGALFDSLTIIFESIWNGLGNGTVDLSVFQNSPIIQAIFEGIENSKRVEKTNFENVTEISMYNECKPYYDMFSRQYNHSHIRYCPETRSCLMELLKSF